ncbi:MAG: porphobilinogen synthase [Spirochaetia bacterium]|nr:porphobilinogen synthase [Spirochaetia bacterium]
MVECPMLHRPRRLRLNAGLRSMVRETRLAKENLISPSFVTALEKTGRQEIASMPGIFKWSLADLPKEIEATAKLGIPAVLLFGIPAHKDPVGKENFSPEGVIQKAVRLIRKNFPDLVVITDVCLCEYTDHGHCGILQGPDHDIRNDETLEILKKVSVSHAEAGAHMVAPSGMMDGAVAAIRTALDQQGFIHTGILSYSAKYASAFYGPFREAAEGAPKSGDRKTHQMDPGNVREALREMKLDVDEGADMLMVKPALAYLDVIRQARERFPELPLAAYNVSGEYAMVKAAAAKGWIDERSSVLEILTGVKRAGADLIISYHAREAAAWV